MNIKRSASGHCYAYKKAAMVNCAATLTLSSGHKWCLKMKAVATSVPPASTLELLNLF